MVRVDKEEAVGERGKNAKVNSRADLDHGLDHLLQKYLVRITEELIGIEESSMGDDMDQDITDMMLE